MEIHGHFVNSPIIGAILKEEVLFFIPYTPDMPAVGDNITVYFALANIFQSIGKVFEGSIEEHVQMAAVEGIDQHTIRNGFEELQKFGYLTIEGDTYKPTEKMLKNFK